MQARVVVVLLLFALASFPACFFAVPPPPRHLKVGPSVAVVAPVASSTVEPTEATEATTTDDSGDDSLPNDSFDSDKDRIFSARRHRRQANGENAVAAPTDASALLADPSLPEVPAELASSDPDCLLWQYVQSAFMGGFSNSKFQNKIQELCLNGTGQGDWCHVNMDLVLVQMDELNGKSPFRVDTSTLEELQIFVQFTQNGGIWQVVELPMCGNGSGDDSSSSDSDDEVNNNANKNIHTRMAFRYLF